MPVNYIKKELKVNLGKALAAGVDSCISWSSMEINVTV